MAVDCDRYDQRPTIVFFSRSIGGGANRYYCNIRRGKRVTAEKVFVNIFMFKVRINEIWKYQIFFFLLRQSSGKPALTEGDFLGFNVKRYWDQAVVTGGERSDVAPCKHCPLTLLKIPMVYIVLLCIKNRKGNQRNRITNSPLPALKSK